MAKKVEKNLSTQLEEAKKFYDVVAVLTADHKRAIRSRHKFLKDRSPAAKSNRATHEESIKDHESDLKKLEVRCQRYERYQTNKDIPKELRKKIAELETIILRKEPGYNSWERGFVRCRKKDLAELFEQVDRILNPPKLLATKNKAYRVGTSYSSQSISRSYDGHVWEVLKGHFERLPRVRGERTSYKIAVALPEKSEYLQLKERHFTFTLDTLLDKAYEIVDELQEELQEAYDNTPEGLQGSMIGEAREQAAIELDNISSEQPDLPSCLPTLQIVHYPSLQQSSRGDRADEAASMLKSVVVAVQQYQTSGVKLQKTELKALGKFIEQLENEESKIECVEFPGMFG